MFDVFYIVVYHTGEGDWYQLRLKDTHFCPACGGDLNVILGTMRKYIRKFKTKDKLLRSFRHLYGAKLSAENFARCEEEYKTKGQEFNDLIYEQVALAIKESKEEQKRNNPFNKTRNRLKKSPVKKETTTSENISEKRTKLLGGRKTTEKVVTHKPKLIGRK